ncbi:MAG: hypothetical protein ABR924_23315 [Terracidiphilus sp.]
MSGQPTSDQPGPLPKKALRDVLLAEGVFALKLSVACQSLDQIQEAFRKKLGQNSLKARRRYAQLILRWFFSDGIDGLLRRAWLAYGDEAIRFGQVQIRPRPGRTIGRADQMPPIRTGRLHAAKVRQGQEFDHRLQLIGPFRPEIPRKIIRRVEAQHFRHDAELGPPEASRPICPGNPSADSDAVATAPTATSSASWITASAGAGKLSMVQWDVGQFPGGTLPADFCQPGAIIRDRLTRKFLFSLPEGAFVVSDLYPDGRSAFAEKMGDFRTRGHSWKRAVATGASQ